MTPQKANARLKIQVHEVFPAFQGEGPLLGRECVFIRLSKCPVECRWCDTPFTWDRSEVPEHLSVEELAAGARGEVSAKVKHAVISGGEPMVWRKQLPNLLDALMGHGFETFEIETAGVLEPLAARPSVFTNISPKLPSAHAKMTPDPVLLARYLEDRLAILKFVIRDRDDWAAMKSLLADIERVSEPIHPTRIFVMPEARTRAELLARQPELVAMATGSGYNVTTRAQIIAFDTERGR